MDLEGETMRDVLKNPILYYILAPILVGLWPLLVWGVYLPKIQRELSFDKDQYTNAENCMVEILTLDPHRLDASGDGKSSGKFTYYEAFSRVADRCRISSRNYNVNAGGKIKSGGKETQGAKVTLSDVGIVQICDFLSKIQSMWVNLECESLKLTKKEGTPDRWDADLSFKYTYL
jgi:hypothetical protein